MGELLRVGSDLFLPGSLGVTGERLLFRTCPSPTDPLFPGKFSACDLECDIYLRSGSLNSPYLIFMIFFEMVSCYGVQIGLARDCLLASAFQVLRIQARASMTGRSFISLKKGYLNTHVM